MNISTKHWQPTIPSHSSPPATCIVPSTTLHCLTTRLNILKSTRQLCNSDPDLINRAIHVKCLRTLIHQDGGKTAATICTVSTRIFVPCIIASLSSTTTFFGTYVVAPSLHPIPSIQHSKLIMNSPSFIIIQKPASCTKRPSFILPRLSEKNSTSTTQHPCFTVAHVYSYFNSVT